MQSTYGFHKKEIRRSLPAEIGYTIRCSNKACQRVTDEVFLCECAFFFSRTSVCRKRYRYCKLNVPFQFARSAVAIGHHTSCAQNAHSVEPCAIASLRNISCESLLVMCHRCSKRLTKSGEQEETSTSTKMQLLFCQRSLCVFFLFTATFSVFRLTCLISILSNLSISIKLLSFRELRKQLYRCREMK